MNSDLSFLDFFYLILQLLKIFPKDLLSLKRAQLLYFYMGNAEPSLALVQQVPLLPKNVVFLLVSLNVMNV